MCDFREEIFQPGFDLLGAHLVEASAGTGKTYNIQNIYARLIMETDFRVSNILVVTFTEAATEELRERLRAILTDLKNRLDGKACDGKDEADVRRRAQRADDLIGIGGGNADDRRTKRLRVELALNEFDNAAVSTIHGFCQRVLRRYSFETGLGFAQNVMHNKAAELEALAEDWWRTHGELRETQPKTPGKIKLNDLKKCVLKLGAKADYRIVSDDMTLKIADGIVGKYERGRLERENLNFDDLLRILRDALKNERPGHDFADKLRGEYKAALVDEFQDTDPVQYDIFRYIFLDRENPGPLYFVGDPKQAIYAFRGGDIYTYFKAAAGLTRHTLNVNYRSTKPLMDAVNAMFGESVPGGTFGSADIAYQPAAVPAEASGADAAERPFQLIEFDRGESSAPKNSVPDIIRITVRRISKILAEPSVNGGKAFSPKDIAILINTTSTMPKMQQALSRAGIPSVIRDSGNAPPLFQLLFGLDVMVTSASNLTGRR